MHYKPEYGEALYQRAVDLTTNPFGMFAAPRSTFPHKSYVAARATLESALHSPGGAHVVTGVAGVGKTTLLSQISTDFEATRGLALHVRSSNLDGAQLLAYIHSGLASKRSDPGVKERSLSARIAARLLALRASGIGVLLVIDEAHALHNAALARVDELLYLCAGARPALRVLMAGLPAERAPVTPESAATHARLRRPVVSLEPMQASECRGYVEHRLAAAGRGAQLKFSDAVYDAAHVASAGIPARVNQIFARLLHYATQHRRRSIGIEALEQVLGDECDQGLNELHHGGVTDRRSSTPAIVARDPVSIA